MHDDRQENRREFIRFELTIPLFAELSLWRVREREIRSRSQRVIVENISAGGCRFKTYLQIPPREDVEWQLHLQLGKYPMQLKAHIVRAAEEEGFFVYGLSWIQSGYERRVYQYRLNEYIRTVLVSSPHIHALYRKISERNDDEQFRKLDITS